MLEGQLRYEILGYIVNVIRDINVDNKWDRQYLYCLYLDINVGIMREMGQNKS